MILRGYQNDFVARGVAALKEHGNGLGVAATGAGINIDKQITTWLSNKRSAF